MWDKIKYFISAKSNNLDDYSDKYLKIGISSNDNKILEKSLKTCYIKIIRIYFLWQKQTLSLGTLRRMLL